MASKNIGSLSVNLIARTKGFTKKNAAAPALTANNSAGAALARGSAAAFSATRFSQRGNDPMKKVADNTKQQLTVEKQIKSLLEKVAANTAPGPGGNLIPT